MKTALILLTLTLCSCQELQFFNLWPKPKYSAAAHYRAKVMASGTQARTAERIQYVLQNKPPRPTKANIDAAIEWPDFETAGKTTQP